MNLIFDDDVKKLIIDAKDEMLNLKHPYVGSEHLLLAMLKNNYLDVTKMLNEYGLTYKKFRSEIISVIGVGKKENKWFLFTPLLKNILNNASLYSDNGIIDSRSLFLSFLNEGDGIAKRILIGMNFDIDFFCEKYLSNNNFDYQMNFPILESIAINMNNQFLEGNYDMVVDREKEVDRIIQILIRRNKNNPLLIGDAGVGKTAIVEELVRRICNQNVPDKLKNYVIYNLPMASLVAGTKYRGEFEERLRKLIDEVSVSSNILIFIDEIHTLVGAGGADGAIDASNILKPFLARGNIKIIGATTTDEYHKYFEKEKALARRFQNIYVKEPDDNTIRKIVFDFRDVYESYHNVILNENILNLIINLSLRYLNYKNQPDAVIDLVDEVCSYCNKKNSFDSIENKDLLKDIENLKLQIRDNLIKHNFSLAFKLREELIRFTDEYNKSVILSKNQFRRYVVKERDVFSTFYNISNIPLDYILQEKIDCLSFSMKGKFYGQDDVIDSFFKHLSYSLNNFNSGNSSFLLVGKSGVGKTFFAEEIAKKLFGDNFFIKLDMEEYKNSNSLCKIIGGIGYYEKNNLFSRVKKNIFTIVLLDNIYKASLKIKNIFNFIFENNFYYDYNNEKISFSNVLFIMTTNSLNRNIGFVYSDDYLINDFSLKSVEYVIKFNDFDYNSIKNYIYLIINNYMKSNSICIKYNEKIIDNFIKELNFPKDGLKNINYLFRKYFL